MPTPPPFPPPPSPLPVRVLEAVGEFLLGLLLKRLRRGR